MLSRNIVKDRSSIFNNGTNEWWTPEYIIDSVKVVLGDIDLDPCSCDEANKIVKARQYYTIETNGYDKPWYGKVFMNPPYGTAIKGKSSAGLWLEKLYQEYRLGNTTEAIAVVNSVYDKKWFKLVFDYPIVISDGRLNFIQGNPDSNNCGHNIYGSCFVYLGKNKVAFYREFSKYGTPLEKVVW